MAACSGIYAAVKIAKAHIGKFLIILFAELNLIESTEPFAHLHVNDSFQETVWLPEAGVDC